MLPDPGEQQKTLTESKNAANEHIPRFARLLPGLIIILLVVWESNMKVLLD